MPAANATIRITESFWSRCFAGEYDAALAMMHPDFVHDDRRDLMSNTIYGRDDTMANNRTMVELGFRSADFEPVATTGDLLALARVRFRSESGDELSGLQLLGTDVAGRRTFCVSYDTDDVDAAMAEFDARA